MSEVIIGVESLGKKYRIRHQGSARYIALRDVVADKLTAPIRWIRDKRTPGYGSQSPGLSPQMPTPASREDFWALKDISFEVKQGEVVGVIGRNGAGKSTLLKILSRITEPTVGRVQLEGRVSSLLEVGTGFHPELTGRENIFLNGAILGMTRAEIRQKFDEIVAFAEVEKFLDTPVKWYSSGMYVRLAFAVAAHLEPEILIVDEVLAVGDAEFQKKCLGKMGEVGRGGRTVLFVSHNMATIEALCESAILMAEGKLVRKGQTSAVVREYLDNQDRLEITPVANRRDRKGSGAIRFDAIVLQGENGKSAIAVQCGCPMTLRLFVENLNGKELSNLRIALGIDSSFGQRVLLLDTLLLHQDLRKVPVGHFAVDVVIPRLTLLPGRYEFTLYATVNGVVADWVKNAGAFDVEGGNYYGTGQMPEQGIFLMDHRFEFVSTEEAFPQILDGIDSRPSK
jgi:lipopolysaccharide transport system ATP-binding protein